MTFEPETFCTRLVAAMADGVILADPAGVIRFWNQGAERIFGYAAAEALGRGLDLIIPEGLRARHDAGFRHTMATGESRYGAGEVLAVPAVGKDGRRLSIEFTIVLFHDPTGQVQAIAAVLRDVTARFEETRALRRALAAAQQAPPARPAAGTL